MPQIIINYDPTTGIATDKSGQHIGCLIGAIAVDEIEPPSTPKDLVTLKEAGFTAEEIIAMKKKNIF